jgi:hypothetical protein
MHIYCNNYYHKKYHFTIISEITNMLFQHNFVNILDGALTDPPSTEGDG